MSNGAPLEGVRIISLAGQYPGPYATLLLGDLGADVTIVERPDGGDPIRVALPSLFAVLNRDKASVAIDLKSQEGRDELLRLVGTADALIDGFRPGILDRLGLDSDCLREANPHLIVVRATGFGGSGPFSARPGHDLTYRAEAGMLMPDGVVERSTLPIADILVAHAVVESVLIGLLTRDAGKPSLEFDVSMFDMLISSLNMHLEPQWNQDGPIGFPAEPGYGTFITADQRVVALGVAHEDKFWRALCGVIDLIDEQWLSRDERFARKEELHDRIATKVALMESSILEQRLLVADVPFGWVRSLDEMANHPQVVARGLIDRIEDGQRRYVPQPLIIDGIRPKRGNSGAPELGVYTQADIGLHGLVGQSTGELVKGTAWTQDTCVGGVSASPREEPNQIGGARA